jgi:hypothetical protein
MKGELNHETATRTEFPREKRAPAATHNTPPPKQALTSLLSSYPELARLLLDIKMKGEWFKEELAQTRYAHSLLQTQVKDSEGRTFKVHWAGLPLPSDDMQALRVRGQLFPGHIYLLVPSDCTDDEVQQQGFDAFYWYFCTDTGTYMEIPQDILRELAPSKPRIQQLPGKNLYCRHGIYVPCLPAFLFRERMAESPPPVVPAAGDAPVSVNSANGAPSAAEISANGKTEIGKNVNAPAKISVANQQTAEVTPPSATSATSPMSQLLQQQEEELEDLEQYVPEEETEEDPQSAAPVMETPAPAPKKPAAPAAAKPAAPKPAAPKPAAPVAAAPPTPKPAAPKPAAAVAAAAAKPAAAPKPAAAAAAPKPAAAAKPAVAPKPAAPAAPKPAAAAAPKPAAPKPAAPAAPKPAAAVAKPAAPKPAAAPAPKPAAAAVAAKPKAAAAPAAAPPKKKQKVEVPEEEEEEEDEDEEEEEAGETLDSEEEGDEDEEEDEGEHDEEAEASSEEEEDEEDAKEMAEEEAREIAATLKVAAPKKAPVAAAPKKPAAAAPKKAAAAAPPPWIAMSSEFDMEEDLSLSGAAGAAKSQKAAGETGAALSGKKRKKSPTGSGKGSSEGAGEEAAPAHTNGGSSKPKKVPWRKEDRAVYMHEVLQKMAANKKESLRKLRASDPEEFAKEEARLNPFSDMYPVEERLNYFRQFVAMHTNYPPKKLPPGCELDDTLRNATKPMNAAQLNYLLEESGALRWARVAYFAFPKSYHISRHDDPEEESRDGDLMEISF